MVCLSGIRYMLTKHIMARMYPKNMRVIFLPIFNARELQRGIPIMTEIGRSA